MSGEMEHQVMMHGISAGEGWITWNPSMLMRTAFLFYPIIAASFTCHAQVAVIWEMDTGGPGTQVARSVSQNSDDGFIIAGYTQSDFAIATRSGHVARIDANGNLLWEHTLGGSNHDQFERAAQTPDGGFLLVGYSRSLDGDVLGNQGGQDVWVVKLDGSGEIQWQRSLGGSSHDYGSAFVQMDGGGFLIIGSSESINGDVTAPLGGRDIWLVQLSDEGEVVANRSYGGTLSDTGVDIARTSDGGHVILGGTQSSNGDVTCAGSGYRLWIAKLGVAGDVQWNKCFTGSTGVGITPSEIHQTTDGGYVVAGTAHFNDTSNDYWVLKLDAAGETQWERNMGSNVDDYGNSIKQTPDGGYIVAGEYWDPETDGNYGIFKLDADGETEWSAFLGGDYHDAAYSITLTSDGNYVVAGEGDPAYDDGTPDDGYGNFWVVKFTTSFNAITGRLFIDFNGNGVQDAGEPSLSNHGIHEAGTGRFTLTNAQGDYSLLVLEPGAFSTSPSAVQHYLANPASHTSQFAGLNEEEGDNDFAFQPVAAVNDLKVTLTPMSPFRPGFNAYYNVHYKNVGTMASTGTLVFKADQMLAYMDGSTTPTMLNADSIVWDLPTLAPYEEGDILITLEVDVDAVLGSEIISMARVDAASGDAVPENNISTWPVTVTGAYDPNDIQVDKETVLISDVPSSPYLEYLIRFQNTGNDTAFTVIVKNPISALVDPATFEFLGSSHPTVATFNANELALWFQFDNILLPDSNVNEALSHGFVRYRMRTRNDLSLGDLITGHAEIFFDFNAPVITNTASTEVVLFASVAEAKMDAGLVLFPNPTSGDITLAYELISAALVQMEMYSLTGQLIGTMVSTLQPAGQHRVELSTELLAPGVHYLRMTINGQVMTRKVVKM
jgi:hypothetical protein